MQGLQTAIVTQNNDPDGHSRIKITLPALPDGIWARLGNVYASNNAGIVFLPEIGDEVIVAFLNDDKDRPVIIGSLYNATTSPPITPSAQNAVKTIATPSQLKVSFDDEKKSISINTPNKNTIIISDEAKSISMADENGNSITMNPDGISFKSPTNITLETHGILTLKGAQGVKALSSGGDIAISGINIKATADVSLNLEGAQMAGLSGGMETTIKGTMVMIN